MNSQFMNLLIALLCGLSGGLFLCFMSRQIAKKYGLENRKNIS
jgi:hypothetical protein